MAADINNKYKRETCISIRSAKWEEQTINFDLNDDLKNNIHL